MVLSENGPDGNINYVYGLSMISATASSFQYFHQFDGLGSTINLTDSSGAQKANYSYDPWGKLTVALDPVGTKDKYKFTGEQSDSDGLVFLRARYYDTSLGHFLSRDQQIHALHNPSAFNKYSYALNNPLVFVDRAGRSSTTTGALPTALDLYRYVSTGSTASSLGIPAGGDSVGNQIAMSWVKRLLMAAPQLERLFNEGAATEAGPTAGGAFSSIAVQAPEVATQFAVSDLQVMDNQAQQIKTYADFVASGDMTMDEAINYIRASNYLPGYTRDKIAYLITQQIQQE